MAETIRDVVIRVSIENAGMKLGPLDTSALESQLSGITGSIQNAIGRGVQGRTAGGWQGMNSFQAQSVLQQNGLQSDLSDYLASQGATFPTQKDRERNIASAVQAQNERDKAHRDYLKKQADEKKAVNSLTPEERDQANSFGKIMREREKAKQQEERERDKAHRDTNSLSPEEKSQAHSFGKIMKEREKAKEKEKKEADASVAEGLKKQAEAAQSAQQANNAYTASVRAGALAAFELAKGLSFVALSGKESDESLAKNIVTIQGYYNVVRGGMNALTAVNDIRKAQAATVNSDGGGAVGAAAGSVAPRAAGLLANPITAALAALAAGLLFKRAVNTWGVEESKHQSAVNVEYASVLSDYADTHVGRHANQSIRMSNAIPNFGAMRQLGINAGRRRSTESQIAYEQSISTRDYESRMQIRERLERRQALQEHADSARNNLTHIDERSGALAGSKDRFNSDVSRSQQAYDAKVANIKRGFRKPTGVSYAMGLVTGQESDYDVNVANAHKMQELKEAEAARQQELNSQKETGIRLDEQALRLGEEKVKSATDVLQSLREQYAAARQNYEQDKQKIDHANENLGSMKEGDLYKIQGVQGKMLQKQRLEQWEIQVGLSAGPGTKVYDYAQAQARQRGKEHGILMSPDLAGSEAAKDAAKNNLNQQEPELLKMIDEQSKKNQDLGKEIVTAIRKAFDVQDMKDYIDQEVQQIRIDVKEKLRTLNKTFK